MNVPVLVALMVAIVAAVAVVSGLGTGAGTMVGAVGAETGKPLAAAPGVAGPAASAARAAEPISPLPEPAPVHPARAALGERLFHDNRLSRSGLMSCATCHPLDAGGAKGRWVSMPGGQRVQRDTPTIFNTSLNIAYNWDGSARTPDQVLDRVIKHKYRLDTSWEEIIERLGRDRAMVDAFSAAYPDGMTVANVRGALVLYQRSLVTPRARFDRYLQGESGVLTEEEIRGYTLFKSIGCVACHQGANVGGNLFQRFGIFHRQPAAADGVEDLGRFWLTQVDRDRAVFRVPSLRNVELTAPYFHDGRAATLSQAVQTMALVQLDRELGAEENQAIVAFLKTLTGELAGRPLHGGAGPAVPKQR